MMITSNKSHFTAETDAIMTGRDRKLSYRESMMQWDDIAAALQDIKPQFAKPFFAYGNAVLESRLNITCYTYELLSKRFNMGL